MTTLLEGLNQKQMIHIRVFLAFCLVPLRARLIITEMNFLLFHTLEYILCRGKWNPDDCIKYKGRVLNKKWGFSSLMLHFPTLYQPVIAVLFSEASSHFSVSFRVYLWRFHHKKNKQNKKIKTHDAFVIWSHKNTCPDTLQLALRSLPKQSWHQQRL